LKVLEPKQRFTYTMRPSKFVTKKYLAFTVFSTKAAKNDKDQTQASNLTIKEKEHITYA